MISQTSVKLPTVRECFPWYDNFVFSFSLHLWNISSSPLLAFNKLKLCTTNKILVLLCWCCLASLVVKFVQCFVCVLKKFHHKTCRLTNNDKVYKYSFMILKAVHTLIKVEILPTTLHNLWSKLQNYKGYVLILWVTLVSDYELVEKQSCRTGTSIDWRACKKYHQMALHSFQHLRFHGKHHWIWFVYQLRRAICEFTWISPWCTGYLLSINFFSLMSLLIPSNYFLETGNDLCLYVELMTMLWRVIYS